MCMEKHVLVKRFFTNGLNIGLPLWAWAKKIIYGVETHSLVKKKFRVPQSVIKVKLTVFWNTKVFIAIDFLEKVTTVTNASYYQWLRQNSLYLLNVPHICKTLYLQQFIDYNGLRKKVDNYKSQIVD